MYLKYPKMCFPAVDGAMSFRAQMDMTGLMPGIVGRGVPIKTVSGKEGLCKNMLVQWFAVCNM